MHAIDLCCLDLAGTTVTDGGAVELAFRAALEAVGITDRSPEWASVMTTVAATMGMSKIEVFHSILGDPDRSELANVAFEKAYGAQIAYGAVEPIPGARAAIAAMRRLGLRIAFITGFAPGTREALLRALDWRDVADVALSPADVGRGRPAPDLVLASIVALETFGVASTVVCGDTTSDMVAGCRAGAGVVAGVLTGESKRDELVDAGATHVLDSVADLPGIVGSHPCGTEPAGA